MIVSSPGGGGGRAGAPRGGARPPAHRLRDARRAAPVVGDEVRVGTAEPVAEQRVAPADRAVERLRVRVEEELRRVEAVAGRRGPRGGDAVAVALPRAPLVPGAVADQ